MGLFAFGLTTMAASLFDCGAYDSKDTIFAQAFVFGGIGQFIAGILEWIKGHSFTGTAFCSYGCFWVSYVFLTSIVDWEWALPPTENAIACFLLMWTILTFFFFIGTFTKSICDILLFGFLFIHLVLETAAHFSEKAKVFKAAGYFGCFAAAVAIYVAGAGIVNESLGKVLMPLGDGHWIGSTVNDKEESEKED